MEPLTAIGAAALGAAAVCAATDCAGGEPQSPQASIVQAIAAPLPPACPAVEPPHVTCAPQQTVTLPPHPPAKKRSTIVVNPPKVEVQVACPERPPPPPTGWPSLPAGILWMRGAHEARGNRSDTRRGERLPGIARGMAGQKRRGAGEGAGQVTGGRFRAASGACLSRGRRSRSGRRRAYGV